MEWLRQLSRAIDYIEENLEGEISYDEAELGHAGVLILVHQQVFVLVLVEDRKSVV